MKSIDPAAFTYLLDQIKDGFAFEKFAQDILCEIEGPGFVPMGGVHDRGIDGLDHTFVQDEDPSTIYQISIQADTRQKLRNTLKALSDNGINVGRLIYVTSRGVDDKDVLIKALYKEFKVAVTIRDSAWLRGQMNHSQGTLRTFARFIEEYTHQFNRPGTELLVTDFTGDPRVFVFLRQQVDCHGSDQKLDVLLVDSLILYALEGTDPDAGLFKTRDEIWSKIKSLASFDPHHVEALLDERLDFLATKPRRIRFYDKEGHYCLPYETRLELDEQNLADQALYDTFHDRTTSRLEEHLRLRGLQLKNCAFILSTAFNEIYKQQGLDFAEFVLNNAEPATLEHGLENLISRVMENCGVAQDNRSDVGLAVLAAIRDIIYRGSDEELEYLKRLSRSYLMLFLIKCDPQVAAYFDSLAQELTVFVDNSLIIPALSEICLEQQNRRHWNLLASASKAGVKLVINPATMEELASHFRIVQQVYDTEYKGQEKHYSDERTLMYVKEILIRAYLYQRSKGDSISFDQFINKIVTPRLSHEENVGELSAFLRGKFGIHFVEHETLGVTPDPDEVKGLAAELHQMKRSEHQARIDAETILTVYGLRARNGEASNLGIFGYKTWWLSKDTTTLRAVQTYFRDKPRVSCYLRPDFLLNYITLTGNRRQAGKVFDRMFPTLVGISISHHVPLDVCNAVHASVMEHKELDSERVKAVVGRMSTSLMTNKLPGRFKALKHFLDEELNQEPPQL